MRIPDEAWRTSSYTGKTGQCVEIGMDADGIGVGIRDTKNRDAGQLRVAAGTFAAFIGAVKRSDGWRSRM